ncbi:MAG: iron-sulfur cluster assembly accessory protein [Elusimicrobia bacterium]|nr:iron-sulfur cluster assembly accessory protein [Elusimicrobiota bacterium]
MVTLTEAAAKKVVAISSKKGQAPVLRVKVGAGGCSGMSYEFVFSDQLAPEDAVSEAFGAKAVVDPKADFFIGGSIIDYAESLMSSGFVIKNPHAASTCSCGKSFTTEA